MTRFLFQSLCNKYNIDCNIAMENENIINVLRNENNKNHQISKIEYILENEF